MTRLFAIALLATAAATPALAQDAGHYAHNSSPTYVTMAASADNYEQESSKLVLQTATNPDVRRFAEMMISEHGKTTAELMAAAKAASLGNPSNLVTEQADMMKALRAMPKDRLERAYVDQQVKAHEQALALHQGYAQMGDNPGLKSVAESAIPIIQRHLGEIRRIQSAMGGPMASPGGR